MPSGIEILDKIQKKINAVLNETYSSGGPGKMTPQVNKKIVKILTSSGLQKAFEKSSEIELEAVGKFLDRNAANIRSKAVGLIHELDNKQNGGARNKSKPREPEAAGAAEEPDYRPENPEPDETQDEVKPATSTQAQDMVANLDNYEILAAFYILFINGGLVATGAPAAAIDAVAEPLGESLGLPPIRRVCGIGRLHTTALGMPSEMSCVNAQQRWETLLISLGVSVFVIVALISSRGPRRIDTGAYSRGAVAMSYELGMSSVTSLANVLRGVPKGEEPPPFDSRPFAIRYLNDPITALAITARRLAVTARRLAVTADRVTTTSPPRPATVGVSPKKILDALANKGGRKKRKTHRSKARKSKKARRTRKKVNIKTRKAANAKKARKTSRR